MAAQRFYEFTQFENLQMRIVVAHPGAVQRKMACKAQAAYKADLGLTANKLPYLAARTSVLLASKEAEFLKARSIWAICDIQEIKARREEILADPTLLTFVFKGL